LIFPQACPERNHYLFQALSFGLEEQFQPILNVNH
jgi:hypothetical protein